jgi:GDP-L-fucose synthase
MPSLPGDSLIVGAGGFLGTNLRRYFDQRGWRYHAIARADGDLRDRAACEKLFGRLPPCERIFHLATFQRTGARQYEIPAELLDANARIHLNVLECWARHQPGAKLITTGSSCAYPESPDPIPETSFQGGPLHESVRTYGLAKRLLAAGSEAYAAQFKLKYLHCILATLYGPDDHLEADRSHFVGGMMSRALAERRAGAKRFTVWGRPDTLRECLYVEDQIEAMLEADSAFENCILNCAANRPVAIDEVARAILRVLGWNAAIEYPPGSFAGVSRKTIDSTRFLEKTGWRPRLSLDEGLGRLLRSLH